MSVSLRKERNTKATFDSNSTVKPAWMKPPSGGIYERKRKPCKQQLAFSNGWQKKCISKNIKVYLCPHFPFLRTVSHVSNWSILVLITTMLWHSGNSWPTFLVAKLWLVWAREPGTADSTLSAACGYVGTAGNGWTPLLCSEHMPRWDWEGVQSAHVTELLSGFPWSAQKSWSKELGWQSNHHACNISVNVAQWRFTSGLVFFNTVFWITKSELIRATDPNEMKIGLHSIWGERGILQLF